jgi:hypothetical protein
MEARPYRRALQEWPNGLIAAVVLYGIAAVLLLIGLTLQLLPDDAIEVFDWAPLGSYQVEDFYPAIVPLMVAGAICAAVALGRARSMGRAQRVLAGVLFTAGIVAGVIVLVTLLLIVLLCSSGACS